MEPSIAFEGQARPLLEWVLRKYPDTPKSRAKQWILAGRVSVGEVVLRKPHQPMSDPGDTLMLLERHATDLDCGTGWQIHPRVSLLYLDRAFAILNKGPGLISVPAPDSALSALSILADFLAGRLRARDRVVAGRTLPSAYRQLEPLPVHRLDQYTTGAFCVATNPAARRHLIEQIRERTMKREYVAFADGKLGTPKGTWRQWLQLSRDEMRQHVVSEAQARAAGAGAQEAITHYEVIAEYPPRGGRGFVTKLRLRLETGRKHQIRVQASHAGVPLIGDRTYNPAYRERNTHSITAINFPRQALHAEMLSLEHPEQPGRRMSWAAEWPRDLRQLETLLRAGQAVHFPSNPLR